MRAFQVAVLFGAAIVALALGLFMSARAERREPTDPSPREDRVQTQAAELLTMRGTVRKLEQQLRDTRDALQETTEALEMTRAEVLQLRTMAASTGGTTPAAEAGANADGPSTTAVDPADEKPEPLSEEELDDLIEELAQKSFFAYTDPKMADLVAAIRDLGPEGIERMAALLLHGDGSADRFIAAAVFEKLKDPAAIPALIQSLESDDDALVRRMASHAIAFLEEPAGSEALVRAMEKDTDAGVRINSAYGLAVLHDDRGIQGLMRAADEETDMQMRAGAFYALVILEEPKAAPLFRRTLRESKDLGFRIASIEALKKIRDRDALHDLQAVIQDPDADSSVVESAKQAYNEILGEEAYK